MSTITPNGPINSGGGLHHEIEEAIIQMQLLKVSELKAVCRSIELPITGRKAILQERIRAYLKNSCSIGRIDPWRPKTIRILIEKAKLSDPLPKYEILWQTMRTGAFNHPVATGHQPVSTLQPSSQPRAQSIAHTTHTPHNTIRPSDLNVPKTAGPKGRYLHFKESPFYRMKKLIPETAQKINITNVRGACVAKFKFTKADWSLLDSNKKLKLYLFCGAVNSLGSQGNEPIQFPHPNEIRFNNEHIKDNVRGLKNKLGTAKPADLTPYVKPSPQQNILEVVYAFTKSEYYTYCYIVEEVSPEEVLQDVLRHPKIIKAATLHYIKRTLSEEEDEDLMTTSTVMSLQCPISYTRMKYPVKSIMCKHLQCYDALWYIYSQIQIPTWQCPVCQIDIDLKDLALCEYVDQILKNSDEDVEQVELSSDGSWVPVLEEKAKPNDHTKSTNTVVKKEQNEEEDDYDNDVPLSKLRAFSKSSSPSNEPVVISLDSDPEEDEMMEQDVNNRNGTSDVNVNIQSEEARTSLPAARLYMDSSEDNSGQTLDPRSSETITPSAPRQSTGTSENGVDYFNRRQDIPNILGKTPLNTNSVEQETSLVDGDLSSPTPGSDARSLFTPTATMSVGGHTNNFHITTASVDGNVSSSSEPDNTSLASTTSLIQKSASSLPRRPSNLHSSSILGLTGQVLATQPAPPPLPPPPYLYNNHINTPINTLRTNGAVAGEQQRQQQLEINSTPSVPRLPPLPHHPLLHTGTSASTYGENNAVVNGNENGSRGAINHNHNNQPGPSRTKKPIISPFIPKKPYLNMLPQKRQLSNNRGRTPPLSNEGNGQWGERLGVSMEDTSASVNATTSRHDDDIIDLTSD